MDFQKTTLFVVNDSNSLPTTGSTEDLTPGQFGVFRHDYSAATVGNIAASKYLYLAQGRRESIPGLGTMRSDKISKDNILEAYKIVGSNSATVQVTEVDDFSVGCGEMLSLTLRLHSVYINTAYANGLTKTVTVPTGCCGCDDDPCTDVGAETLVDKLVAAVNADPILGKYITATKSGSGSTAKLVLTGKALTKYGDSCDPTAFPYEYDRMYFQTFLYKDPGSSMDEIVPDACDSAGVITITQNATYPQNTSEQVAQLEKNFYSYQNIHKTLFRDTNYNGAFTSGVEANTAYTSIYMRFREDINRNYADVSPQDAWAIIAAPATEAAAIITLLETYFGGGFFVDKS